MNEQGPPHSVPSMSRPFQLPGSIGTLTTLELAALWRTGIKGVLSLLIVTILLALAGGVIRTFLDLRLLVAQPVEVALRHILLETLMLLAVVEVLKTTLTYFSEGRVKVTFIVDTILVVMLTEVISQWFKGGHWPELAVLGAILLVLGAMRIVAVRCSPGLGDGHPCLTPHTARDDSREERAA